MLNTIIVFNKLEMVLVISVASSRAWRGAAVRLHGVAAG